MAYAVRPTVTRQPVRATYLQDPDGRNGPVMWAPSRSGGDILAVHRSYAPQARALKALDHELIGAGAAAVALGWVWASSWRPPPGGASARRRGPRSRSRAAT
ncbi:hypothetical protein ACWDBD_45450 [Streptomyces sp. NPDC001118]